MKPIFGVDAEVVFDPKNETYISDFIRKFAGVLELDNSVLMSEAYDSKFAGRYETLREMAEKEGYVVKRVPRYMTDDQKGKEFGREIYIAEDLNDMESAVVLGHEYFAKKLDNHDDKEIQRYQESFFSESGPMPDGTLYEATVRMGERAGLR